MHAQQWQRLKEVVAGALEQPPGRRMAFLDQADLDAGEHRRVEAYLAAYDGDPEFLEDGLGPGVSLSASPSPAGAFQPGEMVDGYRIVRKIGEGGMGEVYEAEQLTPIRRRLALKLLRAGRHDARDLARFAAERQILASMSHRNVAQVFAAGDITGRPYLAMELVEGLPITEYCRRHRLSIEARITLFVEVCRGVQHAHQRGVIHRDLKPSNILVDEQDGEPLPKVIDFGISKAVSEGGRGLTEHGQWLGTPDYMSPEQATGGTLDTRSDVYSLGVLLYELLTGCLPFDTAALRRRGFHVLLRVLREEPPAKPSRRCARPTAARGDGESSVGDAPARAAAFGLEPEELERRLAGDLDLVVLKALEKDADHRYASPLELAQDLLRHLEHRPLLAAEPCTAYTLRKLLRRHRLACAAAAIVLLSLVAGVVGTGFGLMRARAAEREARARAEEARAEAERANREAAAATKVTDFMWGVFRSPDPTTLLSAPGTTLRQVLDRGAERVRRELGGEPRVQARLMSAIGYSYLGLGLLPQGQALLEESVELLERIAPDTPELAKTLHLLANAHSILAEYETALGLLRRSLDIRRRTLGEEHYEVTWVLHDIGRILAAQGKIEEAVGVLEGALALKREIYGDEHLEVGRTLNSLGLRTLEMRQPEQGLPMIEQALAIYERHLGSDHPALASLLDSLAQAHGDLDHHAMAERLQQRALALDERAFGGDHPNVALSLLHLALLSWESRRDCALALARTRRARDIFERHFPPDHPQLQETLEHLAIFEEECGAD